MATIDAAISLAQTVTEVPGQSAFGTVFGLVLLASSSYAAGRIHQWYRHALERDQAYREGYNSAAQGLFRFAVELRTAVRRKDSGPAKGTAAVVPLPVQHPGRSAAAERFERTTARLLRRPRHACTEDEPTSVIHPAA